MNLKFRVIYDAYSNNASPAVLPTALSQAQSSPLERYASY